MPRYLTFLWLSTAAALAQTPSIDMILNTGTGSLGPIAPGGLVSIIGSNLATAAMTPAAPLPTTAGGATVTLGGKAIPIISASPSLVIAQVPFDAATGSSQLSVNVGAAASSSVDVAIVPVAPGILKVVSAPLRASGPVRRSEYLALFCTGLGDVANRPANGANGLSSPLSKVLAQITVQIAGVPVTPVYAGLTPYEPYGTDAVGIYEIDVEIPADAPIGDAIPVSIASGFATSNIVNIAIQGEALQQVIAKWTQYAADGVAMARAITGEPVCPTLTIDGNFVYMQPRAAASFPLYPVTSCELPIPSSAASVRLGDFSFPMLKADVRRIAVLGDTGCRLDATRIQACNDRAQWPLEMVAKAVAASQPDLIMHMGDYHYREAPCPLGNAGCTGTPWGYDWAVWNADVFSKFGPMFNVAPILLLRGNHESCDRAGEGWFRFLDPRPMPDTCQRFMDPYTVQAGPVQIFAIDSSEATDATADPALVAMFKPYFDQLASVVTPNTWVAMHHPIWGFDNATTRNLSLQVASNNTLPVGVQLALAGHIHTFQTLTFSPVRAPQIVIGNGGDFLQAYPAGTANFNGMSVGGAVVTDSSAYLAFGFTTFDWVSDSASWTVISRDPAGAPVFNCTVSGLSIPCSRPQ